MISDPDVLGLLYLVSIVCFVLALRFLSSPKHARRGNWIGGVGMLVAIATTLLIDGISNWALDRRRGGDRERRRGDRRAAGEDDRDAADGGPVQRGRRRRGGAGRTRRVPRARRRARLGRGTLGLALRTDRVDLVRRIARRLREAPGARQRAADRVPGPERRERGDRRCRRGARCRDRRGARGAMGDRRAHPSCAGVRRDVRASDRGRGHAGRDLAPERVHRPRRLGDRLRARLDGAHRRRDARRRLGHPAHAADGEGDEPVDRQRALRRVRPGAGGRRAGASRRRPHRSCDDRRGRRRAALVRAQGRRRSGLRDGGRAGAARRAPAGGSPRRARRRCRRTRSIRSPGGCQGT